MRGLSIACFLFLISATVLPVFSVEEGSDECHFTSVYNLESEASNGAPVRIYPKIENNEAHLEIDLTNMNHCYRPRASIRVDEEECSEMQFTESDDQASASAYISESQLQVCGARARLTDDQRHVSYDSEVVVEFLHKAHVGYVYREKFTYLKNRLTSALSLLSPQKTRPSSFHNVTDHTVVVSTLRTCSNAECDGNQRATYSSGDRIRARLDLDLQGFTVNILSAAIGDYDTAMELDITDAIKDLEEFDGGVSFSVVMDTGCQNCFLRVLGDIKRYDHGAPTSPFTVRRLLSVTDRTAAHLDVSILCEESFSVSYTNIRGVMGAFGVFTMGILLIYMMTTVRRHREKTSLDFDIGVSPFPQKQQSEDFIV